MNSIFRGAFTSLFFFCIAMAMEFWHCDGSIVSDVILRLFR